MSVGGGGPVRPHPSVAAGTKDLSVYGDLPDQSDPRADRTMPRSMMNELYSSGVLSRDEFLQLERLYQVRNQIVHGFASPASDVGAVQFLTSLAQRLLDESRPVKQPA